jgi:hypothetical protein
MTNLIMTVLRTDYYYDERLLRELEDFQLQLNRFITNSYISNIHRYYVVGFAEYSVTSTKFNINIEDTEI